ncbi:MAG: hypothetical protein UY52_C0040G0005 [Parcubacteria group bacterium GW2011_GWC2_49_9]|nr:MAG: hypothetical protein UY34_C0020G0002 [Parcubacteria group bacterium GW2011_GWA2_48_9]KKW13578.1 MAG: hypothetical protein UY52_C0040G0005 [Parcubacteria group bacterium GW2011_GWC2_49_9]
MTSEDVEEFKAIYRDEFHEDLTNQEAKDMIIRVVNLIALVTKQKGQLKWSDFEDDTDEDWKKGLPRKVTWVRVPLGFLPVPGLCCVASKKAPLQLAELFEVREIQNGRGGGTRTRDLRTPSPAPYQLGHTP